MSEKYLCAECEEEGKHFEYFILYSKERKFDPESNLWDHINLVVHEKEARPLVSKLLSNESEKPEPYLLWFSTRMWDSNGNPYYAKLMNGAKHHISPDTMKEFLPNTRMKLLQMFKDKTAPVAKPSN